MLVKTVATAVGNLGPNLCAAILNRNKINFTVYFNFFKLFFNIINHLVKYQDYKVKS